MGDPAHVPLGLYSREALQGLGWWDALAGRRVACADARATLALVERGEVDFGLVYASDARASARVRVLGLVSSDLHAEIRYTASTVEGGEAALAARFLEHLRAHPEPFERRGLGLGSTTDSSIGRCGSWSAVTCPGSLRWLTRFGT